MKIVLLCALGVGGATVLGAILGFIFKNLTHRFSDVVLAFAAGVMLASAVIGLIIPSLEGGGKLCVLTTVAGIFVGALSLNLIDKLVPHLHKFVEAGDVPEALRLRRVMLFVTAIAMHNLPEGIAAGVGFGSGDISSAILIAGGIALQNIPEGMVIIAPMLSVGVKPSKTLLIALGTGLIEVLGTFIGYYAVTLASFILPFALAFAGGTMLYIISDEIIPDTHADGAENGATYALLAGFSLILLFDSFL
ncbi:MAG: ZIP family metal transporter [Clostridia bacterium]|nr:ZIP family metal transporter [Clostridia bacterium]